MGWVVTHFDQRFPWGDILEQLSCQFFYSCTLGQSS